MMAKALRDYQAKRDFAKTQEPIGTARVAKAPYPRFVIQKHDATRLHYDLRLEVDGVFKSWAVTRGPSLDPAEKRLAVEVEDHPLDYGDFEGTIPKGQYGGGTVMLWDRGYWQPIGNVPPAEALRDGELKFVAGGEKLRGEWVIVRMKHDRTGGSRTNWLLIKHRDDYSKAGDGEKLLKKDRSVASGRTMTQIAAGKGAAPIGFIKARSKTTKADAVWHSDATREESGSALSDSTNAPKPKRRTRDAASLKPVRATGNTVLGITISKPDKPLWPESDGKLVTKRDLAEYLATVGPWMLDHIYGRPCSLIRAPDGIGKEQFFQRHAMRGMSEHVHEVKVTGDHEPYLEINSVEGIVAMGQIAALEFHPWNCAPHALSVPGRLIFDLDPAPHVAFAHVIDAAKELRDRLERVGLTAFCKTSGGKGLHVVVPLRQTKGDALDWDAAKTFTQTICVQMADDNPERYLTKMTKKLRTGRIFLDYLRNDRMATAVAPLSPRARPGAPVSMPLQWNEVRSGLDPSRFTIRTAPGLLRKSGAWSDYDTAARPLRAAIAKLVGKR